MGEQIQQRFYDLFSQVARRPGGYSTLGIVTRAMEALSNRYDTDYMKQLFFPDFYPASPMPGNSMIPTVCFKLTDYFSVDPDPTGSFALRFSPEETRIVHRDTGLTLATDVPRVLGIWNTQVPEVGWQNEHIDYYTFPEQIGDFYDQYRLVGASISLEYTGTIQEHSGYLVGGFFPVYKQEYMNLNSLRKAQYVQEVHPMEGMRCIWFPKDLTDDAFVYPGNRQTPGDVDQALRLLAFAGKRGGLTDPSKDAYAGTERDIDEKLMADAGFFDPDIIATMFRPNQSQVVVIYGTGLPTTTGNKFRGKIVRNFEGIPKPSAVDYVGAHNKKTNPATLDAVAYVAEKIPEMLTLPLSVTSEVRNIFDDKYNYIKELVGSMKDYGGTLSANGATFQRGQGSANEFVSFLGRALQ